ncbi:MAG: ATP-dependent metalloprotease, partial [Thiopseudomonas sp.]
DDSYATAKRILEDNRDKLDAMADALMKYETIDSDQIDDIMAGVPVREPKDWSGGSNTPPPSAEQPGESSDDELRQEAPIGGPAGEH